MYKILIGSPVRQKPAILSEFLDSLNELYHDDIEFAFYFVDDNDNYESSELLHIFKKTHNNVYIIKSREDKQSYICDKVTHFWEKSLIDKISDFKNKIIDYAVINSFDYLFLVDSDLVLDKRTVVHLLSRKKDIVSNVFWSQWLPGESLRPQCFDMDMISFKVGGTREHADFEAQLRIPGIYEIAGTGACTLLSNKVLKDGVSFKKISNIRTYAEDKDFCIRANLLGYKLYIDTVYPAYHIYRDQYIDRVKEFKSDGFKFDMCQSPHDPRNNLLQAKRLLKRIFKLLHAKFIVGPYFRSKNTNNYKIVCSMIVRNEAGRYLKQSINSVKGFVDYFVIIDDCSTDSTVEELESILEDFPHRLIINKKQMFSKEYKLRRKLFKETLKEKPGWILAIDADEIFENGVDNKIKIITEMSNVDLIAFRLFDMWSDTHYRNDKLWQAHNIYWPRLLRINNRYHYKWKRVNQHCGFFPHNIGFLKKCKININIKHMGWSKEEDRVKKFKRYMEYDSNGKYGNIEKYNSILDNNPNLEAFDEYDSQQLI